jgi:hypothetical protein
MTACRGWKRVRVPEAPQESYNEAAGVHQIRQPHTWGVNVGTVPAKLLMTVVGIKGKPFTAPAPKQE